MTRGKATPYQRRIDTCDMPQERRVLQPAAFEAISLATIFLAVHAVVLACIFPGFYDPFWPHHSDYYIAQALAYSEGGALQILTQPRPLALLLFSLFGRLGIHGSVIASFGVVVANYIGIAMMMRRAFQLEIKLPFFAAASAFAYLLASHPYQYEFSTWDVFSQLSFLFLLLAANLKLRGHADWQVFLLALLGFLIKETYAASAAMLAAAWLLYHMKSNVRAALAPLAIVLSAFLLAFVINRINGSPFTGSANFDGSPYQIILRPASILAQWAQYSVEGMSLISAAIITLTLLSISLAFGSTSAIALTALAIVAAGALAWLPNSVLPNHHHAAYSWNGAYLLYAPVLLLAAVFQRGTTGFRLIVAAIFALAIGSPSGFAGTYTREKWIVDNQLRQKRLVIELQHLIAGLPSGPSTVVVSGLNGPFSPYDHWQAILSMHPPAGVHFYVLRYPEWLPSNSPSVSAIEGINAERGIVSWINPDQLERNRPDQAWLFRSDGSVARVMDKQSPLAEVSEFGISSEDLVKYPDLLEFTSPPQVDHAGDAAGFRFLKCGTTFLSYNAPDRAEFCLRRSAELIPRNPYSHFYLGKALEALGCLDEARDAYAEAVANAGTSPNPAFNQALETLRRDDRS